MTKIPWYYYRDCLTGEDESRIIYGLPGKSINNLKGETDPSPPVNPQKDDEATEYVQKL